MTYVRRSKERRYTGLRKAGQELPSGSQAEPLQTLLFAALDLAMTAKASPLDVAKVRALISRCQASLDDNHRLIRALKDFREGLQPPPRPADRFALATDLHNVIADLTVPEIDTSRKDIYG